LNPVRVGVMLPQFTADPAVLLDGVRRAEALGLDSMWTFDHLWPLSGGKQRPIFECWSALAHIAECTRRATVGTLVTRSSLRHSALLARMAVTVAGVAPGRLIVAIGSGDARSRRENEAFGIPYYPGARRTSQLAETVEVVGRALAADAAGAALWVGGRGRAALELAGRLADGWNSWGTNPAEFSLDAGIVTEAAAGRPVELSWAGTILIGRDVAGARAKLKDRNPDEYLVGAPPDVAEQLSGLVAAGARHVIGTFPDARDPEVYELWAEVSGALREL
jgi:alkanesulfonate monooxygenase SsuD/methylene tetrahydromethanopterin reductase-like flavin-dependent oxidoreductase (luciferase family)